MFTKDLLEKQIQVLHDLQVKCVENNLFGDIHLAVTCLRLQIPTKPNISSYCPAKCPNCQAELSESLGDGYYKHWTSQKFCDCGQKLDWEGE